MKQTWWTIRDYNGDVEDNVLRLTENLAWSSLNEKEGGARQYVHEIKRSHEALGYTAVPIEIEVEEK